MALMFIPSFNAFGMELKTGKIESDIKSIRKKITEIKIKIQDIIEKIKLKKKPEKKKHVVPLLTQKAIKSNGVFVDFYCGGAKCTNSSPSEQKTLNEWQNLSFEAKESEHHYIQWLFPLRVPTQYNSDAPVLTDELVEKLLSDENRDVFIQNLKTSLEKMLEFYGLEYSDDKSKIIKAKNFQKCANNWLTPGNHNHLRITRILTSLKIFRLDGEAKKFFDILSELRSENVQKISEESFKYWKLATEAIDA
jgi:hypothetical protein